MTSPRNFVVLPRTIGRCGSTWLCDLIDSHPQASCLGELFNPGTAQAFREILEPLGDERAPPPVFAQIAGAAPQAHAVGFKIFRETLRDREATDPSRGLDQADRILRQYLGFVDFVVLIDRKNLTEALASELHVRATKRWHLREGAELPDTFDDSITIDLPSAARRLRNAQQTGDVISGMLSELGTPTTTVLYEDLMADTQKVMDGVFDALQLGPAPVKSQFRKMHHDASFVANLDEVNRVLGPEFGMLRR
ncbi:MAG: hypothetical protein AAF628_24500 [Planctomycetota bacterium]